ncbi:MAG: hypothetical protein P8R54_02860 [Myxococcota bacterium]|nr:hypothetical protein [Myxococcota bacterium]
MSDDLPALRDCGFVRVPSPDNTTLWMTCEKCGKSDHFWLTASQIRCRCGAEYSHAVRPDGTTVAVETLEAVPFDKGPMALADLEWDYRRLAVVVVVALGGLGVLLWALL